MKRLNLPILPYGLWIILFTVIPIGMIVYYAVTGGGLVDILGNFDVILRSLMVSVLTTLFCILFGFPFAYFLSRMSERAQRNCVLLITLPMWTSLLLRTYAWKAILNNNGFLNSILTSIGLPRLTIIGTTGAVVFGMVCDFIPFAILPMWTAMKKIDASIIGAARDLGADGKNLLFRVIIPLSMPGIFSAVIMVFAPSVSTLGFNSLLGLNKHMLVGDLIEKRFLESNGAGSALALVLTLLLLIILYIMNKFDSETVEATLT